MSTQKRTYSLVGLLLILALLTGGSVHGARSGITRYVDQRASGGNDGSSWADAYTDLQDALAAARSGDEIWVARGVYYPAPTAADRSVSFTLQDGVAVYGGFAGGETEREQRDWQVNLTVLSGDLDRNDRTDERGVITDTVGIVGDNAYHVVMSRLATAATVLDGFAITAGKADGSDLVDQGGGGMSIVGGNPTLANITFSGNYASNNGGGMINTGHGPTLFNVIFSGNQAGRGGGMYNLHTSPALTNVTFTGNHAESGGGMYSLGITATPTLVNVVFGGNHAGVQGGGMYSALASPALINVTFGGNHAGEQGGAMTNNHSNPTLVNCILWGNDAPEMPHISNIGTADPDVQYSLIEEGYPGAGNIAADPRFVAPVSAGEAPTTDGNYRLLQGSPAIDAGANDAVTVAVDMDGHPRIVDGAGDGQAVVDMGAFEFQYRSTGLYYVDQRASGGNDGSSWADAYTDLQDALAAARPGDEIWVARGIYYPAPTAADRSVSFVLRDGVAVYGGFAGGETEREQRDWQANLTVLSGDLDRNDSTDERGVVTDTVGIVGDNAYHVVMSSGVTATATLDGFTITAGKADGSDPADQGGGGMSVSSGGPTLANLVLSGNHADQYGGGMHSHSSGPTLTNVTFMGNRAAQQGGGMYNALGSLPTLTGVTFTGNRADQLGGGMYNAQGSAPTLTGGAFIGNHADLHGGGMYNHSSPAITNVTIRGNSAADGGGMYNGVGSPTLVNVVLAGNHASRSGGGMHNLAGSPTLINVTFSGNRADEQGGGMTNVLTSPMLVNCILWGNHAPARPQIDNRGTSAPRVRYSLIEGGYLGVEIIDADPRFTAPVAASAAPTAAGNYRLLHGSPAIDAGTNDAVTAAVDLDGNPRIVDGTGDGQAVVDMGAYEFQGVVGRVHLPFVVRDH